MVCVSGFLDLVCTVGLKMNLGVAGCLGLEAVVERTTYFLWLLKIDRSN